MPGAMASAAGVYARKRRRLVVRHGGQCVVEKAPDESREARWQAFLARANRIGHELRAEADTSKPSPHPHTQTAGGEGAPEAQDGVPFRTFPRQEMAFEYADACGAGGEAGAEAVQVFAYEKEGSKHGRRRYLATTYPRFWRYYAGLPARQRHFYEVIREGRPCCLYFDLEFKRALNPGVDGDELVRRLVGLVQRELRVVYQTECTDAHVIDLTCSTEAKFSRHLVFRPPGVVFANNVQMGLFVGHLLGKVRAAAAGGGGEGGDDPLGELKVRVENGSDRREPLVDAGVYTKNRNFRLYLSSKAAKRLPLLLADTDTHAWPIDVSGVAVSTDSSTTTPAALRGTVHDYEGRLMMRHLEAHEAVFFASLVCNTPAGEGTRCLGPSPRLHGVLSVAGSAPRPGSGIGGHAAADTPGNQRAATARPHQLVGGSPFPHIDAFLLSTCRAPGLSEVPRFRRCLFFEEGRTVIYDLSGYRYCHNIGRHHKSNGIMLVANLGRGVFYQKCHDPDCRTIDYRSPEEPLPPALNPFPDVQWGPGEGAADGPPMDGDDDGFFTRAHVQEALDEAIDWAAADDAFATL